MDPDSKKSRVSIRVQKSTASSQYMQGKSMSRMKMRKLSYGFGGVPGIRGADSRGSQLGIEFKRPPLLFLNTYQLNPFNWFHPPSVRKIMDDVLDQHFNEHKYNIQDSPSITMRIAGEIMRHVKGLSFNRYRIISVVTMAQKRAQSYNNAVAFLWDHERDSIVDVSREVNTAFIQATVFGIYLD